MSLKKINKQITEWKNTARNKKTKHHQRDEVQSLKGC